MNKKMLATCLVMLLIVVPTVDAIDHTDKPVYQLLRVIEVEGRQGVATDGQSYYVS